MERYRFFAERPIEQYRKSDFWFAVAVILLTGLGIFTLHFCSQNYAQRIFHDSFYFVRRQSICILIGTAGFLIFASFKISVIRKMLPIIVFAVFLLCIMTFIPGFSVEKNGARRWIKIPFLASFTLQPSELVKFALVLFLANIFDKQISEDEESPSLLPCITVMLIFVTLVLLQKDLSTSVFIFFVCFLMFAAAGLKVRWIFAILVAVIPLLFLFVTSQQYRIDRIIAFLKPEEGIHTINYQSTAAKRAISAGGFWGAGAGTGLVQSNRIPEVQADYIFAGWTEAMGLWGVIIYFSVLGFFTWRGYKIAFICKNRFASYGAFGFITMITGQSIVNCAVVCGVLPTTGIPLPFFSLGGSSIIITLTMCGFVLNASRLDTEDEMTDKDTLSIRNSISGVNLYE